MTCFVEFACVLCPNAGIFQVFNLFEFFVLKRVLNFKNPKDFPLSLKFLEFFARSLSLNFYLIFGDRR